MVVRQQATMARGGHRWSWVVEEEVLGLGWAFGEKRSEKSCFHAAEHIYNLQISLSELVSLSESSLLALSATFGT